MMIRALLKTLIKTTDQLTIPPWLFAQRNNANSKIHELNACVPKKVTTTTFPAHHLCAERTFLRSEFDLSTHAISDSNREYHVAECMRPSAPVVYWYHWVPDTMFKHKKSRNTATTRTRICVFLFFSSCDIQTSIFHCVHAVLQCCHRLRSKCCTKSCSLPFVSLTRIQSETKPSKWNCAGRWPAHAAKPLHCTRAAATLVASTAGEM